MKELSVLDLDNEDRVTPVGYGAFTHILCTTSTILNTHHSNYTLEILKVAHFPQRQFPIDGGSLLRCNRENSKSQAARLKIFMTHFSKGDTNLHPFAEMDSSFP